MEILHENLGNIAVVDVSLSGGGLKASLEIPLVALLEAAAVKAKAAIPGQIDDVFFDLVIAALKAEFSK